MQQIQGPIAGMVFPLVTMLFLVVTLPFPRFVFAELEVLSSESQSKNLSKSSEEVFSIMQQQLRSYKGKLEESENRLKAFQQEHGIIVLESQINLLLQQRKSLDDSLKDAQNRAEGFKEKLAWIKTQMAGVPKEIPLTSTSQEQGIIGQAKTSLLSLKLKEQELLSKYTENSPHIQSLRNEMALISKFITEQEAQLAGSVTTGKNPVYHQMEMQLFTTQADLVSAEAQSEVILQQIADVDKELDRLRNLTPELEELRRQVKADEKNYLNYLTKVGTTPPQDYQIQVGDTLDIKFFFNPELNETVLVRPDGRIALQLVGELLVVGHTVEQIRKILVKNYAGQLKNPEIAVILRSMNVPGETIESPGIGTMNPGGKDGN